MACFADGCLVLLDMSEIKAFKSKMLTVGWSKQTTESHVVTCLPIVQSHSWQVSNIVFCGKKSCDLWVLLKKGHDKCHIIFDLARRTGDHRVDPRQDLLLLTARLASTCAERKPLTRSSIVETLLSEVIKPILSWCLGKEIICQFFCSRQQSYPFATLQIGKFAIRRSITTIGKF